MGEFFKGWRRKVGLVTLLMALAFIAATLERRNDFRGIRFSRELDSSFLALINGHLVWLTAATIPKAEHHELPTRFFDQGKAGEGRRIGLPIDNSLLDDPDLRWKWRWCGFGNGVVIAGVWLCQFYRIRLWVMPGWAPTLSLTLLSAFLLLTKSRKSIEGKNDEPNSERVA
jgi:hypothetical protein